MTYDLDKDIKTDQDVVMHTWARVQGDQHIKTGFNELYPELSDAEVNTACDTFKRLARESFAGKYEFTNFDRSRIIELVGSDGRLCDAVYTTGKEL